MSRAREASKYGHFLPERRNLVINGDFRIWQRGTSVVNPNDDFTADRWYFRRNGAGVVDVARATGQPTGLVGHSFRVTVTTALAATPAATDNYGIQYYVEGYDFQHSMFGTSSAKKISTSFWVWSEKAGIYPIFWRNNAQDRVYVTEYTINNASTWEFKEFTIPGDTSGTWLFDNSIGFTVGWTLARGSDGHNTTLDDWTASNKLGTVDAVNFMDTVSNRFYLKNVQVEVSDKPTDFEYRPIDVEFDLCQRYYEKSYLLEDAPATTTNIAALRIKQIETGTLISSLQESFRVTKRALPTITWYSTNNGAAARVYNLTGTTNITVSNMANEGVNNPGYISASASVNANDRIIGHWTADAEL